MAGEGPRVGSGLRDDARGACSQSTRQRVSGDQTVTIRRIPGDSLSDRQLHIRGGQSGHAGADGQADVAEDGNVAAFVSGFGHAINGGCDEFRHGDDSCSGGIA